MVGQMLVVLQIFPLIQELYLMDILQLLIIVKMYFIFFLDINNQLTIQWGRCSLPHRSTSQITFPTAMKSTSYSAVISSISGTNHTAADSNNNALHSLTVSGMIAAQAEGNYTGAWIIIGY